MIFYVLLILGLFTLSTGIYAIEWHAELSVKLENGRTRAVDHFDYMVSGLIGFLMIPLSIFVILAAAFCGIFG